MCQRGASREKLSFRLAGKEIKNNVVQIVGGYKKLRNETMKEMENN